MPKPSGERRDASLSACGREVRDGDPDAFLAALFAPADRREDLFALLAFNLALAGARDHARQPLLAEIRLQWWRDALDQAFDAAAPAGHPALLGVVGAARRHGLPREALSRLVEAHADVGADPPATLQILEGHVEATTSAVLALALAILGVRDPASQAVARHVGLACGLCRVIRALPRDAAAGRVMLPANVMAGEGIAAADVIAARRSPGLQRAVAAVAELARAHLANVRRIERALPREAAPVLALAGFAARDLATLARNDHDPFAGTLDRGGVLRSLAAAARALRGRLRTS
jgi:phytoene synthase